LIANNPDISGDLYMHLPSILIIALMVIVVVVMGLIIVIPSPTPDYSQTYSTPAPVRKASSTPVQKVAPKPIQKPKKDFVVKQETGIHTPSVLPKGQELAQPKTVTGPSAK
jgi:hypothetical protein